MSTLGDWISEKYKTQAAFADALDVQQSRVSKWLSGREPVPETYQKKIFALKYKGPWPIEEAQESPAGAGGPYVTEKAFIKLEGRVEALEKVCAAYQEALWYLKLRLKEDLKLDLERDK